MSTEQPTEKELLKSVLEPLLEDFQYWFGRSRSLENLKNPRKPKKILENFKKLKKILENPKQQ